MHVRLFKHSWCSHLLLRWGPNKSLKKCFHTSHVRLKETQITESTILPGKVKNTSDNVSPSLDRSTVLPAGLLDHSYLDIPQKKVLQHKVKPKRKVEDQEVSNENFQSPALDGVEKLEFTDRKKRKSKKVNVLKATLNTDLKTEEREGTTIFVPFFYEGVEKPELTDLKKRKSKKVNVSKATLNTDIKTEEREGTNILVEKVPQQTVKPKNEVERRKEGELFNSIDQVPAKEFLAAGDGARVEPFVEKNNILLPFPIFLDKPVLENTPQTSAERTPANILSIEMGGPGYRQVPSVTMVLNQTMSESSAIALALWRKRKIAEVGEEGFKLFMQEAKATGKDFHTSIETCLRGVSYDQVPIERRISGHWLSLKSILGAVGDVRAVESSVVHPQLKYKGVVDCVASHDGNLVVIDWKTSQRRKSTLEGSYDDPIQIAAYVGAINADPNYPFQVDKALLVVAYPTGMPADVLPLDREQCRHYWQLWLQRLQQFHRARDAAQGASS